MVRCSAVRSAWPGGAGFQKLDSNVETGFTIRIDGEVLDYPRHRDVDAYKEEEVIRSVHGEVRLLVL